MDILNDIVVVVGNEFGEIQTIGVQFMNQFCNQKTNIHCVAKNVLKMRKKMQNLGDRMKRYEFVARRYLTPKVPVIIRVDGRAFHTFTISIKATFNATLQIH